MDRVCLFNKNVTDFQRLIFYTFSSIVIIVIYDNTLIL